jgi:hypothetical protein
MGGTAEQQARYTNRELFGTMRGLLGEVETAEVLAPAAQLGGIRETKKSILSQMLELRREARGFAAEDAAAGLPGKQEQLKRAQDKLGGAYFDQHFANQKPWFMQDMNERVAAHQAGRAVKAAEAEVKRITEEIKTINVNVNVNAPLTDDEVSRELMEKIEAVVREEVGKSEDRSDQEMRRMAHQRRQ